MPVTMRYSASLDRTYEENNDDTQQTPPPTAPQNLSSSDHWNDVLPNPSDESTDRMDDYRLSGSMDSLALDDDSNSSASGHSRQHSSDGGSSVSPAYATRVIGSLNNRAPPFDPMQFVKTTASPLVKKAEAQIKQYEEVKKIKELVKEEAEEWQSNLDVWKSRRRLSAHKSVQRVEESKMIDEELERKRRKSKTFSEMMEERSKRGTSKTLPAVYNSDDWSPQVPLAVEEDFEDLSHHEKSNGNGVDHKSNGQKANNGHNGTENKQQVSGFEEAIRSYAEYAEETNSKAKTCSISSNDEDLNTGKDLNYESYENLSINKTEQNTKEVEEIPRAPGQKLSFIVQLRKQSEHKDFGFNVKNIKGVGTGAFVETIQPQSPAAISGLQINDELLDINGESCTENRSHSAIVFAIKQAVYTGQLQLTVYRYDDPESVLQQSKLLTQNEINNRTLEDSPKVDVGKRRSLFERQANQEPVVLHRRSLDLSSNLKEKVASFENNHWSKPPPTHVNVKPEKKTNGVESNVENDIISDDSNSQVGSGLKCGFELASTLQETPIVDSAPTSPLVEPQFEDHMLEFDLMSEDVIVVNEEPVVSNGKTPEPPKEKPPPPPPPQISEVDPSADPAFNKTVKLRRVASTKRILKEIHKRRSDFLGIEDDQFQQQIEQQMSQVSPPPNADEMLLKMEKEFLTLTSNNDSIGYSHNNELISPTTSSLTNNDDIDQKEREIIESLEQWEEEQKLKVCESEVAEAEKRINEVVPEAAIATQVVLGENEIQNYGFPKTIDKTLEEKEMELKQQEERLKNEKEKLRKEQEDLIKQKEEYEKQIQQFQQIHQQQRQMQSAAMQAGLHVEQMTSIPNSSSSPAVTNIESPKTVPNKGLPPPVMTKPKFNERNSFSSTDEESSSHSPSQTQPLTKPNIIALSASPKAKLMDGEEWMQRRKRENYHQHWLVQEAEFRRLQAAQGKEMEKTNSAEERLMYPTPTSPSKHHVINMEPSPIQLSPIRQSHSTSRLNDGGQTQGHVQKSAPRPPAKPAFQAPPVPTTERKSIPVNQSSISLLPSLNQTSPVFTNDSQMLSVSGKKRCSHCSNELGRGAAMIIESLQLFYHIGCFKCCVCHVQLGNGSSGTDVRVRSQKLHCHNCYSNDEGLKFSKV